MTKAERGRFQAPAEHLTRREKNLALARSEALIKLKQIVLHRLIIDSPAWAGSSLYEDLIVNAQEYATLFPVQRGSIIKKRIVPRKRKLHLPDLEPVQHEAVQEHMRGWFEQIGVEESRGMTIVNGLMSDAVRMQIEASKERRDKKSGKSRRNAA